MNLALVHRKSEVRVLEVRSLTPADLDLLRRRTAPIPIRTLRDRHHHIAWLIALGKRDVDISVELRISPTRIGQLKVAPAFIELIDRYRAEIASTRRDAALDLARLATENMVKGEQIISKAIDAGIADPSTAPDLRTLNRIVSDRMDRFGYPKRTVTDSRSVNINFAGKLEDAIARSRKVG